ncbi:hypothetical protein LJD49_29630, partial [Escherichia coli]|uniref:hypothetical protein n=1 Tax=Escherichia coli TaxID=562 RepID=UPI001D0A1BFA
ALTVLIGPSVVETDSEYPEDTGGALGRIGVSFTSKPGHYLHSAVTFAEILVWASVEAECGEMSETLFDNHWCG